VVGLDFWIHHWRIKHWNSPTKDALLPLDQQMHSLTAPDSSFSCEPTEGLKLLIRSRLLLLQISDAWTFEDFVFFGTAAIIIFGVGLYSVAPSSWTTIEKLLLCFF
jgi:hypothetical protein